MSRSVHTRPRHILAAKRVRAPYEHRSKAGMRTTYRQRRLMKAGGMVPEQTSAGSEVTSVPLPRIVVTRPREAYLHPARSSDIAGVLRTLGEECIYGLREVSLVRRQTSIASHGKLLFGTLQVPGRIILYEQAEAPWTLAGRLNDRDKERLMRAGATVELLAQGRHTLVHWPGTTLRDFMLFDVLLHEIAHHIIQQYKAKRSVRVARTGDHESFARLFVMQYRSRCENERGK